MCEVLKISRGIYYYKHEPKKIDVELENKIIEIFINSRNIYGTRKIKHELKKNGYQVSRSKIGKVMKKYELVSKYTIRQFKAHKTKCNEEKIDNVLKRNFNEKKILEAVVSDLTYVDVNGKWCYICIIMDLYNREIIGNSVGNKKDSNLVYKAFTTIKSSLENISIFHTDRGNEFKNNEINKVLETFNIQRSLSKKGCPYDNAVAEATFKILKTEFVFNEKFKNLEELKSKLMDYINWYNNVRIHGSLGYDTPVKFKEFNKIILKIEKKLLKSTESTGNKLEK